MEQLEMFERGDTRLSYSSARLLQGCEQRYWHYKVSKTQQDSDVEDNTKAFAIGSSFHKVLEDNKHEELLNIEPAERNDLIVRELEKCVQTEGLDEKDMALTHAMLIKYLRLRKKQGFKTLACEYSIPSKLVIGFIDLIEEDPNGGWWISDMKTAKTFWSTLVARLPQDRQINLYSHFAMDVARDLKLDLTKFKGCRYLVTTKSAAKKKANESYMDFVARMANGLIKSYAIEIPVSKLNPAAVYNEHVELHKRSMQLREGEAPTKNFGYCENYFKPCPYWSQCHGDEFTNLKEGLNVEVEA